MPVRRGLLGQPRRHRSVDQHSPEPRAHGHSRRVSRTFDKVADVKSVGAKSTIDFFFSLRAENRSPWPALQQHSCVSLARWGYVQTFTEWFLFMTLSQEVI